jgi:hypothetical protein
MEKHAGTSVETHIPERSSARATRPSLADKNSASCSFSPPLTPYQPSFCDHLDVLAQSSVFQIRISNQEACCGSSAKLPRLGELTGNRRPFVLGASPSCYLRQLHEARCRKAQKQPPCELASRDRSGALLERHGRLPCFPRDTSKRSPEARLAASPCGHTTQPIALSFPVSSAQTASCVPGPVSRRAMALVPSGHASLLLPFPSALPESPQRGLLA